MNIGELKEILKECKLPDDARVKFIRMSTSQPDEELEGDGTFKTTTCFVPVEGTPKREKLYDEIALMIESID